MNLERRNQGDRQHDECESFGDDRLPAVGRAVGVGVCGGILAWAIKSAYRGDNDAFNHIENYVVEGAIGAGIAAVATLSFIMTAA